MQQECFANLMFCSLGASCVVKKTAKAKKVPEERRRKKGTATMRNIRKQTQKIDQMKDLERKTNRREPSVHRPLPPSFLFLLHPLIFLSLLPPPYPSSSLYFFYLVFLPAIYYYFFFILFFLLLLSLSSLPFIPPLSPLLVPPPRRCPSPPRPPYGVEGGNPLFALAYPF